MAFPAKVGQELKNDIREGSPLLETLPLPIYLKKLAYWQCSAIFRSMRPFLVIVMVDAQALSKRWKD